MVSCEHQNGAWPGFGLPFSGAVLFRCARKQDVQAVYFMSTALNVPRILAGMGFLQAFLQVGMAGALCLSELGNQTTCVLIHQT